MRLQITTTVSADLKKVKAGFNESLFLSLNPPFPPVKLLEFGGCKKGDRVSLDLNFILFRQQWTSLITSDEESDKEWFFVDEGIQLPFFLTSWKHKHIVIQNGNTRIIDDIQFSTGWLLFDYLIYPILWLQFAYRKPIYKKRFSA